jgi:hypothetical protein
MKAAVLWLGLTENPPENKERRVGWWLWIIERAGEPEFSASFDHQASATTISFLFLDRSPPKAPKTVSFFVSFQRGATKSGILFLVSIARATARRIYRCRPWLSDVSPLEDASCWCLARLGVARVGCRTEARKTAPRPSLMKLFKLLSSG